MIENNMSVPQGGINTREVLKRLDPVYLLIATISILVAMFDPAKIVTFTKLTLGNLAHTSVYMVFAILSLAYIKATGAEFLVRSAFNGRENRMIILAAFVGGLAPFCSCEVIPMIAGLLGVGTPLAPIMAFWLSSPLVDPPSLFITAGVLGWEFALAKTGFAVGLGLFGGFIVKSLVESGHLKNGTKMKTATGTKSCCAILPLSVQSCCETGSPDTIGKPEFIFWRVPERRTIFYSELRQNILFLMKWMLLAYCLESLMVFYLPAEMIAEVVGGDGIIPIIVSAIVGVPAYLNSYVAPPLVSGLMEQGMSPGAAMAFIIAGAVSSIPAMTAVFALVKKRVFAAYVILGLTGAVISGIAFSLFAG